MPDGDFIDIDWINRENNAPLVLILHGLEGSIDSHYAKGLLRAIALEGWRGAFIHFRGCSGEPNRLPTSYHSGATNDIQHISHRLLQRAPNLPMAAIGFSLGGNVLLKWLGETGKQNPLKAAIAISVPFELRKTVLQIQSGFSKFYQQHLLKCVCRNLIKKFKAMPTSLIDIAQLRQVKTMYALDDQITAPLHGFSGAEEYYATASSRQYLHAIQVPTLILHAKDDPLVSENAIPNPSELGTTVQLELSKAGGHVGFVSGPSPWRAEYWLEQRAIRFLRESLA